MRKILSFNTLAPDIVEAIYRGEEPDGFSLQKLFADFPEERELQRAQLGFPAV